jgi:KRAB domain-containing zinc finger protein
VPFSPIFKSIFSLLEDTESNLTIITEFDQKEVEILSKYCTQGILPLPLNDLAKEIPYEIVKVFSGFGIDLYNILFKKKDQDETFKKEDITDLITEEELIDEILNKENEDSKNIVKNEQDIIHDETADSDNDDGHKDLSDGSNDENILEEQDSENEPIAPKSRKRKRVPNNDIKIESNHSQLMSKYNNYMMIQEKYKDHLCVTIPNIGEPDSIKFSDYVPIQPLEAFWKAPRPPSRKKKKPKGYEKYPLQCKQCPKRFTSDILHGFHVKVYHNAHFQCPYCPNAYHQNETGKFKKHLFNHEHVTKTALPHECIQCGKQDFCLQRLQKHIDNFRGPCHNNQCTQCHDFFKSHQDYKVHVEKIHFGIWKYRCDDCEKVFDSIQASREHRLEAHKRKQPLKHTVPTMCDICGKVLKGSSIPNHMKLVHMSELPDTPCPHCGKIVKELQRHIKRSHEKLTCDLCGKLVPPGHMLRHNDQYHTAPEERRYKCEVCNKGFSTKQRLTDHVHTHTGEKPYTCQYCGKGFANSSGCRLHVRFTHLGQKRLRKK